MDKFSTWRVLIASLIISLGGGFHYGYQISVINPSEHSFRNFINASYEAHYGAYLSSIQWNYLWTCLANVQTLGAFIGTFFIRYLLETLGRKKSFYVTNAVLVFSCFLQSIAQPINAWELLLAGRFLCGIATGTQLGLQSVYFYEISRKETRGLIGSMTGFQVEVAFLIASILALPTILGTGTRWPYLFAIEALPSLIALLALPFLPESPKYLASKGDYDGARKALEWFGRSQMEARNELDELKTELEKDTKQEYMSVKELFQTPYIRKSIFIQWMVTFSAAYSGITALGYFSTTTLEHSNLPLDYAQYGTILIALVSCLGALFGSLIVDKLGRRQLMLSTNAILIILNILIIVLGYLTRVHSIKWTAYANISAVALLSFIYCIGPTIVIWFLASELVPQRARSTAYSVSMFVKWIFTGSAGLIFYPLEAAVLEFSFLLHIIPLLASIIYLAVALPETKNRSTLEIMKDLGYKEDKDDLGMNERCAY